MVEQYTTFLQLNNTLFINFRNKSAKIQKYKKLPLNLNLPLTLEHSYILYLNNTKFKKNSAETEVIKTVRLKLSLVIDPQIQKPEG